MRHFGIDYGSRLAGTTVVCWNEQGRIFLQQSERKQDADRMILQLAGKWAPQSVFIDAPLSLPGVYFSKGSDYFYRRCDRELKAMSPMFLGGLTARAMQLSRQLESLEIHCRETYPAGLVRLLPPLAGSYAKKQPLQAAFCRQLQELLPLPLSTPPSNWHHVDALLAWLSGHRFGSQQARVVGDPEEGLIIL